MADIRSRPELVARCPHCGGLVIATRIQGGWDETEVSLEEATALVLAGCRYHNDVDCNKCFGRLGREFLDSTRG